MKRLLILLLLLPFTSFADEIYELQIDVTLHKDRSATVREYYRFVPGSIIKRGLVRTLPVKYFENALNVYETPLEILSVTVDGEKSPYHYVRWFILADDTIKNNESYTWKNRALEYREYRIGQSDVLLTYEQHSTTIEYRIDNIIKEVDGKEVFGWNFQGYGWSIDRDSVKIKVHLDELEAEENEFYAGSQLFNSKVDKDKIAFDESSNTYILNWGELAAGEDITGYFYFPSGTFSEYEASLYQKFNNQASTYLLAITLILTFIIWFIVWYRVVATPRD